MRKKVFIATPFESRMTMRGNRLPKLADYLVDQRYEVEYVTTNFNHSEKRYFSTEEIRYHKEQSQYKLTVLNVTGYKKNISVRRIITHILLAVRFTVYFLKHIEPCDVVLIPSRPPELVFGAAAISKIKKMTIILDITDIWPDMLVNVSRLKYFLFSIYCNLFLRRAIRKISRFVHSAPSFCKWLHRYNSKAESIFVPLGFDRDRWSGIKFENRKFDHNISLVYIGLLQHQIDVKPLLQALKNSKNYTFTIIGDNGEGERFSDVQDFIKRHNINNAVIVGTLPRAEVVEYLKKMDIGIVPMISNSLPNKLFDYIAAYLPIISLGNNDTSDFVKKYDIGWTVAFDDRQIGHLLDCLTLKNIVRKSENIRKIRYDFSREYLFNKILRLVNE